MQPGGKGLQQPHRRFGHEKESCCPFLFLLLRVRGISWAHMSYAYLPTMQYLPPFNTMTGVPQLPCLFWMVQWSTELQCCKLLHRSLFCSFLVWNTAQSLVLLHSYDWGRLGAKYNLTITDFKSIAYSFLPIRDSLTFSIYHLPFTGDWSHTSIIRAQWC